ncbi:MAG: SDR family NAD(P)-dependent oxidoreductase, partial [Pseudomonadota bacterium]|nr:SDR family NAD(P)-dependent oxidoreductase [Pseudomonadota bacterium]
MNIEFDDRLVVVTGGAQGIGQATASGFKAAGARVHLLDIDSDGVEAAAAEIGTGCSTVDLGDQEAVAACIQEIEAAHGPVDILASSAGGVRGQIGRPISEVSEQDWRTVFAANVDAAFWLA